MGNEAWAALDSTTYRMNEYDSGSLAFFRIPLTFSSEEEGTIIAATKALFTKGDKEYFFHILRNEGMKHSRFGLKMNRNLKSNDNAMINVTEKAEREGSSQSIY